MTQHCKVTLGNISLGTSQERVFDSKNQAFVWLNHQLCRLASNQNTHELYFRVESYDISSFDRFVDPNFMLEPELPF